MNREIKFRAWDIFKKVFIPTDTWTVTTSNFSYFAVMIKDWEDYRVGEYMYPNTQALSEYTGLKDKNNKDIYESDIVKVGEKIMEVIFDNGCYYTPHTGSNYRLGGWGKESIEVIGNIFQNSEILNNITT